MNLTVPVGSASAQIYSPHRTLRISRRKKKKSDFLSVDLLKNIII